MVQKRSEDRRRKNGIQNEVHRKKIRGRDGKERGE